MQKISVTLCLGLLLWVEPASAKDYLLKVSVHRDLPRLFETDVDSILQRASMFLKSSDGGDCDVTFKRKGSIDSFGSDPVVSSVINSPTDLEAVHGVPADVKVVKEIKFCTGDPPWQGCSFRPDLNNPSQPNPNLPKTIIVVRDPPDTNAIPNLWAHEFGHTTGLHHRLADKGPLMTACPVQDWMWRLTRDECSCFLAGPRDPSNTTNTLPACSRSDPHLHCTTPPR